MNTFWYTGRLAGKYCYRMKTKALSFYFLYSWLIIFSLIPLILIVITSFFTQDSVHLINFPLTLTNYGELFTAVFAKIFFRSLLFAAVATICCLLLAYPASYALLKLKHKSLCLLLLIIPFWTSAIVRTYSLVALLKAKGIINNVLISLHFINTPILLLYSNFAVVLGLIYNLFPFMLLPIYANMERFDFKLIEAAQDLGANKLTIFFQIFLPNTINGIIAGCLLVFLPAMTLFYIPDVLGGARSILMGNLIQDQFLNMGNWPQGAATSVVLSMMMLICIYRCYSPR